MTELTYRQTLNAMAKDLGFKLNEFSGYIVQLNDGSQILCQTLTDVHGALEMLRRENENVDSNSAR